MQSTNLSEILLMIIPLIFAITIHESAHGYVALYYGDDTAKSMGRLSLNPMNHIDPIGTIVVPLIMLFSSLSTGYSFIFGWAKPVPVNPRNFSNYKIGNRMVAISGPISNLIMSFAWAILLVIGFILINKQIIFGEPLRKMCVYGIQFNAVFFVLNMLPILPLDGGRFIDSFLPAKYSLIFQRIEPYGTWVILILLMTGVLSKIIHPILNVMVLFIYYKFSVNIYEFIINIFS